MNTNPIRQEHTNYNRDHAGVLPRDHHDQEPKRNFVGRDRDSSSAKDQGKNNMTTERLTEKSMRRPGEESPVVEQEYLSSNAEKGTKPKTVVDNPIGYDPFLLSKGDGAGVLVGGDNINKDDLLSKEKKKSGRSSTPYSDPSENVVDSVPRTSSPLEKEKKGRGVQSENVAGPTYSTTGPVVPPQTQSHSEKKTVESFPRTTPSYEKEKKEMTGAMLTLGNEQIKDDGRKTQYTDPPKTTHASTVGIQSKPVSTLIPLSRTQSRGQNTSFESIPSVENEKKGIISNGTAGRYPDSPKMKAADEVPSTVATEKDAAPKSKAANVASTTQNGKKVCVEAAPYVAEKNIAVPYSGNNEARANKTSTTTGSKGKGEVKPKKGIIYNQFVSRYIGLLIYFIVFFLIIL
ncbi:uncharacterized protein LOC122308136 isoform X2 [Carya illinoinensis]|uniref:uncharacterized protein LOC122308136 isoform X2 n=1 Tax=Carya illinoinensis TaxID=32201 RepID=UPI001C71B69A|nr:uncharacterized protein LOC122308136 isoform X2 [Carya illinoinensis]